MFLLYVIISNNCNDKSENFVLENENSDNIYMLDDGSNGNLGLHNNMCSPSCCSPQYPPPFPVPHDPLVLGHEFVASNMTCMNTEQNVGCLCLRKDQAEHLGSRGGNA